MSYNFEKRNLDILDHHHHVNKRAARENFARIVSDAQMDKEIIVITNHGEPAAALISIEDLRILDALDNNEWGDGLDEFEVLQLRDLNKDKIRKLLDKYKEKSSEESGSDNSRST